MWLTTYKNAFSHVLPNHSLVIINHTVGVQIRICVGKNGPLMLHLSRSHKVVGTNMDRSATSWLLLVIHSNHGPVSYCFWDKWRFLSIIENFCQPLCI